jgi:hypothetical protein
METVWTSETSVYFNETIPRYIPEDCHLQTERFTGVDIRTSFSGIHTAYVWQQKAVRTSHYETQVATQTYTEPLSIGMDEMFTWPVTVAWIMRTGDEWWQWNGIMVTREKKSICVVRCIYGTHIELLNSIPGLHMYKLQALFTRAITSFINTFAVNKLTNRPTNQLTNQLTN